MKGKWKGDGSMILKIIGASMTIASMSAIGFYFSLLLKIRLKELKELKNDMFILKGDIRYNQTPLPEALEQIGRRDTSNFKVFFEEVSRALKENEGGTFMEIWKQNVDKSLKDTCLVLQDREALSKFGECLGFLDKEMQMNTIDLYIAQLDLQIDDLTSIIKERTRLYNLLGIMAGVFVTIIFI